MLRNGPAPLQLELSPRQSKRIVRCFWMIQQDIPEFPVIIELDPLRVSREEMIAFSERFDPQPFHLDEAAAAATLLGGLSASAWYVCTKLNDLLSGALALRSVPSEVVGAEQIILLAPVRAGDVLNATTQFGALQNCRCGNLESEAILEVTNQSGQSVARMTLSCVIGRSGQARQPDYGLCCFRHGREARATRRRRIHAIRFFEDVEIGDEIYLGDYEFGNAEVHDFLQRAGFEAQDREPYDHDLVPSWHLPSAWMQCMVSYYERETIRLQACGRPVPRLGPAAGIKQLRWHRPIAVGETITFRGWAERKISIPSQKHWGLLVVGAEGIDPSGKVVVSFYPQMLLERAAVREPAPVSITKNLKGT